MFPRLFSSIASFASIIGVVFSLYPSGEPFTILQIVLIVVGIIAFLTNLYFEYEEYKQNNPKTFDPNSYDIKEYMHDWISNEGRVVISTHDMSWVTDKIKELLYIKAKKNELVIVLPSIIPLAEELQKEGAVIYDYNEINYVPQSRFTIINHGKMDARVAVGKRVGNKHIIEEFALGQHPIFSVANDFVEVISKYEEVIRSKQDAKGMSCNK